MAKKTVAAKGKTKSGGTGGHMMPGMPPKGAMKGGGKGMGKKGCK